MEIEKVQNKFFVDYVDGKMRWFMIDVDSGKAYKNHVFYNKYKPCFVKLVGTIMVALNPEKDKSVGYQHTYQIIPSDEKFKKLKWDQTYINSNILKPEFYSEIKN